MRTIYKYPVCTKPIDLPSGAKILTVQLQEGIPHMWVEQETSNPMFRRHLYVVGTGRQIPTNDVDYVGTYQEQGGALVWHVYITKE